MQFGFVHGRETAYALFGVRKLEEEYGDERKLFMCYVDIEKAFDKVPRKVIEQMVRKKGLP